MLPFTKDKRIEKKLKINLVVRKKELPLYQTNKTI